MRRKEREENIVPIISDRVLRKVGSFLKLEPLGYILLTYLEVPMDPVLLRVGNLDPLPI